MTGQTATTPMARMFGTNHPHVFYWWAAIEVVFFVVLGAVISARTLSGGIAVMVVGLVCGAITAVPAHWSERHADLASAAVAQRKDRQMRLARNHPLYFLVVVPIIVAADASVRWNTQHGHRSTLTWVVPALIGLLFGLILGTTLVLRARRATRSRPG